MRTEDRKAAVNAYKKREVEGGIYAVRCVASGEAWVGGAPDLSKIQNRPLVHAPAGHEHAPFAPEHVECAWSGGLQLRDHRAVGC